MKLTVYNLLETQSCSAGFPPLWCCKGYSCNLLQSHAWNRTLFSLGLESLRDYVFVPHEKKEFIFKLVEAQV